MIEKAVRFLQLGKVIVFPTETVYGFGCGAFNRQAVQKIYQIKERSSKKHLPLMFGSFKQLQNFADLTSFQEEIIKKFSPGPVTFIIKRKKCLKLKLFLPKKIAVRIPDCSIALKILNTFKKPVAATSVNISGKKEVSNFLQIDKYIKSKVDLIITNNQGVLGVPSTIIDISDDTIKVLRLGTIKNFCLK